MTIIRHLIICTLMLTLLVPSAFAQQPRLKIRYAQPPVAAAMHPSAKGALIGGAIGAGFWGGVGLWYCTVGPNEVGECDNASSWTKGVLVWSAVGAGIGALIGALR